MPTSDAEGKDWSLEHYRRHLPDTVTDIGPGEGTYARLFRSEHEGVWWTGVEIHKPYLRKYRLRSTKTRVMYDELHVLDARDAPDHLYHRDLVIAGDVLEHMPRTDAVDLLSRIEAAGAWHILVSVPIVRSEQGPVDGNPHEAHVHQWDPDDMGQVLTGLGGHVETMRGNTLGVWWWSRRG
ncbi:class I SAM-dependent methyltransferase [Wenjunlia vitaminophila]|uniref:class I SAM-dependent methyltransferase n=1 Tax=Wenjunlia vitaminophila TaxID=76728 RepID=UPI00035E13B7|nr:class I SAM-dependent methyltransferase [Wenjunlia vitaminophila]